MSDSSTSSGSRRSWLSQSRGKTNIIKAAMNRLLTRKKAKKAPVQQRIELDLTSALPSDDNFRTSLLMPGLSTRFSMLREQDDPNSLLGKASDDSVLMPNRRSRLFDFGYSPSQLGDIAEVSSLHGSVRPHFAPGRRQDSFASADGYGTDDESLRSGSVMSRARPGEGNNLFGGRQKIYKIPVSGQSERSLSGSAKGGMGGRALYEDDVNLSSFQIYKRQERERLEREQAAAQALDQGSPSKAPSTPALSTYNTKRETSSSTTSGQNARTSTAATSVTSQGPNAIACASPGFAVSSNGVHPAQTSLDRTATKGKRLYEQGLDRDMQDQHIQTLNRLNSVQRGRNGLGIPYMSARSTPNLADRYQRGPAGRTTSPVPHGFSPMDSPVKEYSPQERPYSPADSRPISPISPVFEDHGILSTAIDPNDRGKATALGLFNKPKQYTESEYLQRQKSLLKGRSTPTMGRASPAPHSEASQSARQAPLAAFEEESNEQTEVGRARAPTESSVQEEKSGFSFFHNAASQMRRNLGNANPLPPSPGLGARSQNGDMGHEATRQGYGQGAQASMKGPQSHTSMASSIATNGHPAYQTKTSFEQGGERLGLPDSPTDTSNVYADAEPSPDTHAITTTAPRAPSPQRGLGASLSGMVQHLRSNSDRSSIYDFQQTNGASQRYDPSQNYSYGQGSYGYGQGVPQPLSPTNETGFAVSSPWEANGLDGANDHIGRAISMSEPQNGHDSTSASPEIPWEDQMRREHSRGPSVETTAERQAFANELAERQRAIQEKLKNSAETELRSPSPTPTKTNGFKNLLRAKSSKESIAERAEQSRARKLQALNGSSTNLSIMSGRRSEEDKATHTKYGVPIPPDPEQTIAGAEYRVRDRSVSYGTKGKSPPASTRSSGVTTRNRSDSDQSASAAGRSRSRGPRYKDDLDRAMAEGTSSRTVSMYPESVYSQADIAEEPELPPPVPQMQNGFASPRLRSNSRTNSPAMPQGQWEQQNGLHPAMRGPNGASSVSKTAQSFGQLDTNVAPPNFLNRPSPTASQGPAFSPAGRSPILSQGTYSGSHTPVSGATTPVYPPTSFSAIQASIPPAMAGQPAARSGTQRKKSVMKHEISEPTLISMTSNVDTVNLPPGASLKNGQEEFAPPVPPINPRRKMFGFGKSNENTPSSSAAVTPLSDSPPNQSSFFEEDDVVDRSGRSRSRSRLRKPSSDVKGAADRSRRELDSNPMPAITSPQVLHQAVGNPPIVMTEGGMF